LQKIFNDGYNLKVKFSGNFYNGLSQYAVISPQGKLNYQDYSFAGIKFIATQEDTSGYCSQTKYDISQLNPKKAADTAVEKCLLGQKKVSLSPGKYDVILEPQAAAELLLWLNYIGFSAKSVFEETSFLYAASGKRITGDPVTIYDYGKDKNTFILPFDFEGLPRKKAYLIKKGIAVRPLCDTYYAKLLRIKPTGHANFPDDVEGPLGYNLIMEGGKISEPEIIRATKHAILVTRFHYINGFLNTHKALMTGMTRDGTILVEDGKIKRAIKDMRFTESILEAFTRIKHISQERQLIADHLETLASVYAPSLYIKGFSFTS
jgi:predicted Zn-dependent protease